MSWKLLLLLVSVPLTAAGNLIAGRYALDSFTPTQANTLRYALALVLLLPMVKRWPRPERRDLPWLAGTGLLGIWVYNFLFFSALQLIPASEAGLLEMIIPAASLALAWLVLKEKITSRGLIGVGISFLGIVWLMRILPPSAAGAKLSGTWQGEILMVVAVCIFAVYSITSKFAMRRLPPPAVATWSCVFGLIPMLAITLPGLVSAPEVLTHASLASWLGVLYGGVIGFVYNIIAWYYCFRHVGVAKTNIFLYLVPVFGAMLAIPIFRESLTVWQLFGAGLTLVGVVLATWPGTKKPSAAEAAPAEPPPSDVVRTPPPRGDVP
ncbi:DMT family transporter [Amycolatopsis sp. MtRt-6]|uniref:DMT family transporter n=1 Tax=Amycolatopsis sp. MtRt-6 TaxID=2792782 RepID=UPI001A8C2AA8|nr:DMT family transporter [Amycolatopsis sp. MtRt-6]